MHVGGMLLHDGGEGVVILGFHLADKLEMAGEQECVGSFAVTYVTVASFAGKSEAPTHCSATSYYYY